MRKWNVDSKWKVLLLGVPLLFAGCSAEKLSGPVQITVIRPVAGHCNYEIAPTQVHTLSSLSKMQGLIGSVVTSSENLDEKDEIFESGKGLHPIDAQFLSSNGVYGPVDLSSLFAASLYSSIETGYLLFKQLDPTYDMAQIVPRFSETKIIHNARRNEGRNSRQEIQDNAEYLPYTHSGSNTVTNYFLSYPTNEVSGVPLGLNLGIMVHEFTHLVFHHLFYEPGFKRNTQVSTAKPTANTLAALDEGNADYFGYLAAQDPGFFLCSFPQENRDLRVEKYFTQEMVAALNSKDDASFDPHEGGAVWAAIQYQIGLAIGSNENGKSLIQLMAGLLDCADAKSNDNLLALDFTAVARCHKKILAQTRDTSNVHQIYQKYLGSYGSGL